MNNYKEIWLAPLIVANISTNHGASAFSTELLGMETTALECNAPTDEQHKNAHLTNQTTWYHSQ